MPLLEIGYIEFPDGLVAPILRAICIDGKYFLEARLDPGQAGKIRRPVKVLYPDGSLCHADDDTIRWDYGVKTPGSTWTISYDVTSLRRTDA